MRKLFLSFSVALLLAGNSFAQNRIMTVYAGTGIAGYSGDGGPATAAMLGMYGINSDAAGNIYVADNTHGVVRKIDGAGIITTVAGTGATGYSGDGGPATAATTKAGDVCADAFGNIYIADDMNNVVRKVNAAGIISTIAGTGVSGYSGDGGPATMAQMSTVAGVAVDAAGNIYLADIVNHVVRKISTTGIIVTVAGVGTAGYAGDGGAATAARLNSPKGIAIDGSGNLYIADGGNNVVRKVDGSGVITTLAGTGVSGYSGDGGPATAARLAGSWGVNVSTTGDVYICEYSNLRIRKVSAAGIIYTVGGNGTASCSGYGGLISNVGMTPVGIAFDQYQNMYIASNSCNVVGKVTNMPAVVSDSFSLYIDPQCGGVFITAVASSSSTLSLKISYGDGNTNTSALASTTIGYQAASFTHGYDFPGMYTMKMVLYNGSVAIDSATYSYNCLLCNTFKVGFYYDANGNCTHDPGETATQMPMLTEVDSNGVAIDTISSTSGFDYTAWGMIGDIYSFRTYSMPAGLFVSCPGGAVITDTMKPGAYNTTSNELAFSCNSVPGFDLAEYVSTMAGRHTFRGDILVNNGYCTPQPATVTLHMSPKYDFHSATPAPTSSIGGTVTWNFSNVSITSVQPHIRFTCETPGTWLMPGDTVHTNYETDPKTGDMQVGNNSCVKIDTVTSSFDPNSIEVTPEGIITSGTELEYTIHFENTGNDTAENIHVMDTLSSYLLPSTMRIVASSATMNVIPLKSGGYTIVKFDFPHIKLLDSSHHNECTGMLIYKIKTKSGLPDGTIIPNRAGIYFDDNEVVLTNTVNNVIGTPATVSVNGTPGSILRIYPNPVNDVLVVDMSETVYTSIKITNCVGQVLMQQEVNSVQTKINVKALPAGVYYLSLAGQNGNVMQKFVKLQ